MGNRKMGRQPGSSLILHPLEYQGHRKMRYDGRHGLDIQPNTPARQPIWSNERFVVYFERDEPM